MHKAGTDRSFVFPCGRRNRVCSWDSGFADFWKAAGDYREGLIAYGTHLKVLQNAIKSDALCLLLPVFAALPYTSAFLEEIDSGFIKSYLPRAGRWHYISAKILAAAISGGAACTLEPECTTICCALYCCRWRSRGRLKRQTQRMSYFLHRNGVFTDRNALFGTHSKQIYGLCVTVCA